MGDVPLLSAHGIGKRYGRKIVLEGAELALASGEAVALVGEDGAGKSSGRLRGGAGPRR